MSFCVTRNACDYFVICDLFSAIAPGAAVSLSNCLNKISGTLRYAIRKREKKVLNGLDNQSKLFYVFIYALEIYID